MLISEAKREIKKPSIWPLAALAAVFAAGLFWRLRLLGAAPRGAAFFTALASAAFFAGIAELANFAREAIRPKRPIKVAVDMSYQPGVAARLRAAGHEVFERAIGQAAEPWALEAAKAGAAVFVSNDASLQALLARHGLGALIMEVSERLSGKALERYVTRIVNGIASDSP
jgi:hypothetical protein